MYIYLDKQGTLKEIINDEALRQTQSNVNTIKIYFEGLQENDIKSVLATYGLPDGTITDEAEVATGTTLEEIPYDAERDLKHFEYYKEYPFYEFNIADEALAQDGTARLMVRFLQKDGACIKVGGLICFDVEAELVKDDYGVTTSQYNCLVKAWAEMKECLPLDGSKAMQGDLNVGAHDILLNGKKLKNANGALNYDGKDVASTEDTNGLQRQIDTINATQNVVDIVGTKADLNAYATKDLHANDKIEVLVDESQSNANTIYSWNGTAWALVGSKAPYYSKAESDARYDELKAKSYDKDATIDDLTQGHVPDSHVVEGINEDVKAHKQMIDTIGDETTKNAKNIENLSAVTPTDINVDANGYVILEHDGTEITGQKKQLNTPYLIKNKGYKLSKINNQYKFLIDYTSSQMIFRFAETNDAIGREYLSLIRNSSTETYLQIGTDTNNSYMNFHIRGEYSNPRIEYKHGGNLKTYNYEFPLNSGTFALTSDLDAKQDTLLRHHITMNGTLGSLSMDLNIPSGEKYDTMDKLIAKYKGIPLACNCISGATDSINFFNTIIFGETQATTTLNGWRFKGGTLNGETLESVLGNTITIVDTPSDL